MRPTTRSLISQIIPGFTIIQIVPPLTKRFRTTRGISSTAAGSPPVFRFLSVSAYHGHWTSRCIWNNVVPDHLDIEITLALEEQTGRPF